MQTSMLVRSGSAAARPHAMLLQRRAAPPTTARMHAAVMALHCVAGAVPPCAPVVAQRRPHAAAPPAALHRQQQQGQQWQQQHPSSSRNVRAAAFQRSSSGKFDPLGDVQRELGMQSNQVNPDVREAVERAIEASDYRLTVGEAAARAGVKLADADAALKALAYDSLGHLEVSSAGEVVYAFDRDFKSTLRSRSALQRLRPLARKAAAVGAYLVRVAFGGALIASVLVVWLAVAALASSSRDSDRRDRGGGYYGGGGGFYGGGIWIDPFDLFLWADPGYSRHARERLDSGREMNFVEGIFSWVFGDGDPNQRYEERRWRALGRHIQRLGGVVSAEEMAPFLDPPPLPARGPPPGPNKYADEAFVLPALIRFGGEPVVGPDGALLYKFPALQVQAGGAPSTSAAAARQRQQQQQSKVPLEREWEFSAASPGQQLGAVALGVANVVGVVLLSSLLADPVAKLSLYRQGFGFVLGLLPALQAYAGAFFAIPLVRAFVDARRNARIDERNEARLQALEVLAAPGDAALDAKLAAARRLGGARTIGRADIVYTTERGADEQANAAEAAEFDRKLGRQDAVRRRSSPAELPAPRANRVDDVFGRAAARERAAEAAEIDARRRGLEAEERARRGARRRGDDDWGDLDRW